ncbi:MAG: spheroidene monooxygenase [Segetibacter sp.]|nr:spheroidene monooxygenase [Segetibacter sp.]
MQVVVTIVRYPKWRSWIGFHSMALFHLPLLFNKNISFYKLLGTGKNGSFDKKPDLNHWAVLVVLKQEFHLVNEEETIEKAFGKFIHSWWKASNVIKKTMVLEPIEGRGLWDGKQVFGQLPKTSEYNGKIAVLTRASIKLTKVKAFWDNVAPVSSKMKDVQGLISSIGIGEFPWIKQGTLSTWENKESMEAFAYKLKEHTTVIEKTRKENWYSEEMFVRFKILASFECG